MIRFRINCSTLGQLTGSPLHLCSIKAIPSTKYQQTQAALQGYWLWLMLLRALDSRYINTSAVINRLGPSLHFNPFIFCHLSSELFISLFSCTSKSSKRRVNAHLLGPIRTWSLLRTVKAEAGHWDPRANRSQNTSNFYLDWCVYRYYINQTIKHIAHMYTFRTT